MDIFWNSYFAIIVFLTLTLIWLELKEVNHLSKKNKANKTVNFLKRNILFIISFLLLICILCLGIWSSKLKSTASGFQSSGSEYADILINFPTWIGAFLGVIVGVYLTFLFNKKKQEEENFEEFIVNINCFYKDLIDSYRFIESVYCVYQKSISGLNVAGRNHVFRSLFIPKTIIIPSKIEFNIAEYSMLDNNAMTELYNYVRRFNSFIINLEELKSEMDVQNSYLKSYIREKKIFVATNQDLLETLRTPSFINNHGVIFLNMYLHRVETLIADLIAIREIENVANSLRSSAIRYIQGRVKNTKHNFIFITHDKKSYDKEIEPIPEKELEKQLEDVANTAKG